MSRGPILRTFLRSSSGLELTDRNTFLDALWSAEADVDHWGRFNLKVSCSDFLEGLKLLYLL